MVTSKLSLQMMVSRKPQDGFIVMSSADSSQRTQSQWPFSGLTKCLSFKSNNETNERYQMLLVSYGWYVLCCWYVLFGTPNVYIISFWAITCSKNSIFCFLLKFWVLEYISNIGLWKIISCKLMGLILLKKLLFTLTVYSRIK